MKESEIQNQILEYLVDIKGLYFWRNNNTPIYDTRKGVMRRMPKYSIIGISDILGVVNGKFVALEVKKPRCHPTDAQKEFIGRVQMNGGIADVVHSIEDVDTVLDRAFLL